MQYNGSISLFKRSYDQTMILLTYFYSNTTNIRDSFGLFRLQFNFESQTLADFSDTPKQKSIKSTLNLQLDNQISLTI